MVTIRPARDTDAQDIARVHIRAWRHAYAGIMPAGHLAGLDEQAWTAAHRARLLAEEGRGSRTDVAYAADGTISGFASCGPYRVAQDATRPDSAFGEVYAIYVDPARLGTGCGLALMRTATAYLRERGWTEVRLWVLADNARARRFYERFGFAPDGATSVYTLRTAGGDAIDLPEIRYAARWS